MTAIPILRKLGRRLELKVSLGCIMRLSKKNNKAKQVNNNKRTQPNPNKNKGQVWWLKPVILATWEAEIRRIMV
jgi:hypothetical protein